MHAQLRRWLPVLLVAAGLAAAGFAAAGTGVAGGAAPELFEPPPAPSGSARAPQTEPAQTQPSGQAVPVNPEVGLIGALLYLHHTAAALAAQLRTDAVIPAAVVRHWAGRAGAVLAAAAALGLGIATLPAQAPVWSATGLVILGAASAVTVAAALAYLLHRRSAP